MKKIGWDICRALNFCRRKNIVHRDIKPQNLLFNQKGDILLADFGLSKTISFEEEEV